MTQNPAEKHREDLSVFLSERAVAATVDRIGLDAVMVAKRAVIDILGVTLAGPNAAPEYVQPIINVMRKVSSPGPTPTLGLGERVTPLDAVFWHGSIVHSADFDDLRGYCHPSASVVSAVLPLVYLTGPVDGDRLLSAIALGQDLVLRVAEAIERPMIAYGWLPSLPNILGATLACTKVLDLDAEQTRNALGLALHSTSGTMQAIAKSGSSYRAIRGGKDARAGAITALLAAEGLPGDPESFEGEFGLFPQYFGGEYDAEFARTPEFLGSLIAIKAWPCAGYPQLFLTALTSMLEADQIRPDEVTRIRVVGSSELLPQQCSPISDRAEPKRTIDAKASIPFLIGKLLTNRSIGLRDFTPEGLRDPRAIAMAQRVEWELRPSLARDPNGFGAGIVEIEHADSSVVRAETETPLGHPDAPLSWDALVAKFQRCVSSAASPVSAARIDRFVSLVADLEGSQDASELLETLYEDSDS